MKLHLGMLDVLLVIVLVFAGIIAHNWYNNHPTGREALFLKLYADEGKIPKAKTWTGGGGMTTTWEAS